MESCDNVGIIYERDLQLTTGTGKNNMEKFISLCDAFSHSDIVKNVTFENSVRSDSLAFDEEAIETLLLKDNNLETICISPQIKKVFFLFEVPIGDDLLLVIEKSKCDAAFYYDKRSYNEKKHNGFFRLIMCCICSIAVIK